MKEERFTYLSVDGKTTIHGVFWIPDSTALAVLQISHGMTEYAQRYRDLAEVFTRHGYKFVAKKPHACVWNESHFLLDSIIENLYNLCMIEKRGIDICRS
ncbi:Putative lysophospholipase [Clostridiales bacterium CHKCI001]|nr:Putative lysophospholipase [Clostridiales bacterium CHKCI001]